MTRPAGPVLVGGDFNAVGAARVVDPETGRSRFYDPDPYQVGWFPDLVYQCDWRDDDATGRRTYWADRRPCDIVISGGLHDVAATLNAPGAPTVGHHPADVFGQRGISRRIDHIYATADLVPDLVGYRVVDTEMARQASDHLPVVVSLRV
jgi:hypothetical protein